MQYKIPNRMDIPKVRIEFESSYEKTGPFGAKSIGELVIDTPCPAIANAVYNATGVRVRELPITRKKLRWEFLSRKPERRNEYGDQMSAGSFVAAGSSVGNRRDSLLQK